MAVTEPSVLDDIRRALGHRETTRPTPLAPFNEVIEPTDSEARVARFAEEARAVRAQVQIANGNEQLLTLIS